MSEILAILLEMISSSKFSMGDLVKALIQLFLLALLFPNISAAKVRKVFVRDDQIVTVRTAIGIATIIQAPDRPNSIVVGDLEAFKVEYLDQAITIKPLHPGAKSNLYVYTDWRRYNIQLITGPEPQADYVVYIENAKDRQKATSSGVVWTAHKRSLKNESLVLELSRMGRVANGLLVIEFSVTSSKNERLRPEWLWLTQKAQTKPIHGLLLSSLELKRNEPVQGVIQILKSELSLSEPFKVELRREKTSFLTLPKVAEWK